MKSITKSISAGLILAAALGAGSPALASGQDAGMASNISTGSDGSVWFSHDGPRTGTPPACANANGIWIFSVNTPGGQAMLANLLTATAAGKKVLVVGTGVCIGDHEAVAYVVGAG